MNKKGWIEIAEAFIVILLIMGVLLIAINKIEVSKTDFSSKVYGVEIAILREIQLNDSYRNEILSATDLPIEWDDANFPVEVKQRIIKRTPSYLTCIAKICVPEDPCYLTSYPIQDTYSQSVVITSNLQVYDPRQLKIFCWITG